MYLINNGYAFKNILFYTTSITTVMLLYIY